MKKICLALLLTLLPPALVAEPLRPNVLRPEYQHDRWVTLPRDIPFEMEAYTASFDGEDDDNGDGQPDRWGIPEWVSYEIKGNRTSHPVGRPSTWFTDAHCFQKGVMPADSTYGVKNSASMPQVASDFRFARGHMCPKEAAQLVSADAAFNTHTMFNAVPQLQWQNAGIWRKLEVKCMQWAQLHERVWVTCGPVFFARDPSMWLGQHKEIRAAIPDALFKIVAREHDGKIEVLAYLMPNIQPKLPPTMARQEIDRVLDGYLTSVDRIESLTGLNFFSSLPESQQQTLEAVALKSVPTSWALKP